MSAAAKTAAPKPSFGLRLKAWWDGYDADELAARMAKPAEPAPPPPKKEPKLEAPPPAPAAAVSGLSVDPWDSQRVDISQLIWGEGFCGPGGPEYIVSLSKLLTLSAEMSMMHLGAGLGGPARVLAKEFGVWLTGFETSPNLVDAGNELSTRAGLSKKAPLALLDLDAEKPFERKYDRAMADNYLSYVENSRKGEALEKIWEALKDDGLLLIRDNFFADDGVAASELYRGWQDVEPKRMSLATTEEVLEQLEQANFIVRVNDDRSQELAGLITQAWAEAGNIVARLMADPAQAHLAKVLLREAEIWNTRVSALRSGKIQARRILAARKEKRLAMMSNW